MDKTDDPIALLRHIKQEYADHYIRPRGRAIIDLMTRQQAELDPVFKQIWRDVPRCLGRYHVLEQTVRLAADFPLSRFKAVREAQSELAVHLDDFGKKARELSELLYAIERKSLTASVTLPGWMYDSFMLVKRAIEEVPLAPNRQVKNAIAVRGWLDSRYIPTVRDLLVTLGEVDRDTLECEFADSDDELAGVIAASQKTSIRDFIRGHDAVMAGMTADYWLEIPKGFRLSHANLARLCSVCLEYDVTADVVRAARKSG